MADTPGDLSGDPRTVRAAESSRWHSLPFGARWCLIFGALGLALVGTVTALNSTVYSAAGFVHSYLDSLAAGDSDTALAGAGLLPGAVASAPLLAPVPGELDQVQLRSDTVRADGTHLLRFSFTLRGSTRTASFSVLPDASRWLVFAHWRFAVNPIGAVIVTTHSDPHFTANGHRFTTNGAGASNTYAVLLPAVVTLSHDSTYLNSVPTRVEIMDAASPARASVTPRPKPSLVAEVQKQLTALLDDCVTQTVLQPTGCPFGQEISNEVEGVPRWSMRSYPKLTIVPGEVDGTWLVPRTTGTAHLVVPVRALFDGSQSIFDQDVAFSVSYNISFTASGIAISAR